MKSQMLTLILLIIGAFFFQPTHQYRLSKRELTEYDLISFIVGTCSADQTDMLIQNLCDQTLQSALMGNFPFLTYYCNTIGAGMSYCNNINRHTITNQNVGTKRFIYRRTARSLNEDNKSPEKVQEMDTETDLKQKLIMQACLVKTEKTSIDVNQFCARTLHEVQQGRYPEITRLCKSHPAFEYCRQVHSYSSSLTTSLLESLSSLLPTSEEEEEEDSNKTNLNPPFVPPSASKISDIESTNNQ